MRRNGSANGEWNPPKQENLPPKVLVVEDEALVGLFLSDLLDELGYEVCGVVATGKAALANAAEHGPRVALVDIGLKGGLDGVETAVRLLDEFGVTSVLVSGQAAPELMEKARRARPAAVLSKPYTPDQLKVVLDRIFMSAHGPHAA